MRFDLRVGCVPFVGAWAGGTRSLAPRGWNDAAISELPDSDRCTVDSVTDRQMRSLRIADN
jgi:hypothetical protein